MITDNSLIAVIIPTYNRAYVIKRALHSVLHQTYQNLEVIVVDDGSTDNTEEIVKSFADSRVRYIRHEVRRGAPAARNTGINATRADFIAFQDSDDEWLCDKLEKQMQVFSTAGSEVGVVYTGFLRLTNNTSTYYPPPERKNISGNILESLLHGNFIGMPTVLIKKECFAKAGVFDEKMPRLQDWELFIRIAKQYEFLLVNEPLLLAFYSNQSITTSNKYDIALKLILDKHRDIFSKHMKILLAHRISLYLGRFQHPIKQSLAKIPILRRFMRALFYSH